MYPQLRRYNPAGPAPTFDIEPFLAHDHRHAHGQPNWIQSPYFATGDPESEEMTTLYAPGMLGCLANYQRASNNFCAYRLVKQASGVSGVVGNVFVWSDRPNWTATTTVTNIGLPAGVGEKIVATAASYIWIAVRGNRPVLFIDSPTTAPAATGVEAVVSSTTGKADGVTTEKVSSSLGKTTSTQDSTSKLASVQLSILDAY